LAAAALLNGVFTLHTSALFARGEVWNVTKFHILFVGLLWGSAVILIPLWSVWGYCAAEMVALVGYAYLAYVTQRSIGSPSYRLVFEIAGFVAVPLFVGPWIGPVWSLVLWVVCAAAAITASSRVRVTLGYALGAIRNG
jgi:O-antigen/teichoic acid export membrane protein